MKKMKDYQDLHLRTDVFLLTDVFQPVRKACHNSTNQICIIISVVQNKAGMQCLKGQVLLLIIDLYQFIEKKYEKRSKLQNTKVLSFLTINITYLITKQWRQLMNMNESKNEFKQRSCTINLQPDNFQTNKSKGLVQF